LTRVPPFTAANEMDLLIKVRDAKYRPISELQPAVPAELEAIADRCLTRSRAQRYQTAQEAEADLRSFLRKYVPNYSRSHLGRYVRKNFATEIERELRMLEEFVLSDEVSDDVGQNLIASADDVQPEAVPFQPKPTSTVASPAPPRGDFEDGTSRTTLPKGGGFDLHTAETVILDARGSQKQLTPPAPSPSQRSRPRTQPPLDDFDEALHNAPTLILDAHKLGKRR
jgi:hypothetical protein